MPAARSGRRAVAAEPVAAARPAGPPAWLQFTTLALAILGLGLSAYETYAHFNGSHLAGCPTGGNGTFNCTAVITSSQSMVFGVFPVAVLGLAFYVVVVRAHDPVGLADTAAGGAACCGSSRWSPAWGS